MSMQLVYVPWFEMLTAAACVEQGQLSCEIDAHVQIKQTYVSITSETVSERTCLLVGFPNAKRSVGLSKKLGEVHFLHKSRNQAPIHGMIASVRS